MKRPSFQFYPADWRNNAKLRRCSDAARGAWMDILCLLHDMDEYGVCRWPLVDLAKAANVKIKLVRELVEKNVLKGDDSGAEPYVYMPYHGGKYGESVVLVENNDGPVWYCSRLVRDEHVRQKRGQNTRFDEENQPTKPTPKVTPKPTIGEREVYGSTSSSTSSSKTIELTHSNETNTIVEPTLAANVCLEFKKLNILDVNPSHPKLLAMLQAGTTLEELVNTAKTTDIKKFPYVLAKVEGMRKQAAAEQVTIGNFEEVRKVKEWRNTDSGIVAKAISLGIATRGVNRNDLLARINLEIERQKNDY